VRLVGGAPMTTHRGSCLCRSVTFEVDGPINGVGSCHCSKCRKVSGTGGNAQFIVRAGRFRWTAGGDGGTRFTLPDGWGPTRCGKCGSPIPASFDGGERIWVPAGLMDDDLGTDFKMHIFCGSRADWDRESPAAQHYDEDPR